MVRVTSETAATFMRMRRCVVIGVKGSGFRVSDVSRSVAVSLLLVMILKCQCKACGEVYLPLRVLFLRFILGSVNFCETFRQTSEV